MAETDNQENTESSGEERESQELQGAEGEDGEEGAKPKSKKTKIILVVLVVVIIAAGIGTFFYLKNKKNLQVKEEVSEEEVLKDQVIFQDLDDMIINLNTEGKNVSFMKLKITVEVGDKASLDAVQKMMPKIIDVFQLYLRELTPRDMHGSVGLYRLKEELLLRINKIILPNKVNDLLFKEVLVQ